MQLVIDEPLQYFSAVSQSDALAVSTALPSAKIPAFDGDLKVHLLPVAENQILIRLENLADLFDAQPVSDSWFDHFFESAPTAETPMFDLKKYALDLYAASDKDAMVDVKIVERNLSNNQDYAEMAEKKFVWQTEDGSSSVKYPADEVPNAIVAL